jgi:hypothetical protein
MIGSLLDSQLMYAFPLIVAVSLVYGATRHEQLAPILQHAVRGAMWILIFMSIIFVALWLMGRQL